MTASETRALTELMPYITVQQPKICAVWIEFNEWYFLVRHKAPNMATLLQLLERTALFWQAYDQSGLGKLDQCKGFETVKAHDMLHFFSTIMLFGSTESYRCELAETYHKRLKQAYRRTNKQGDYRSQVGRILPRMTLLEGLQQIQGLSAQTQTTQRQKTTEGTNHLVGLDLKSRKNHESKGHPWGASISLSTASAARSAPRNAWAKHELIDGVSIPILPHLQEQVCSFVVY